MPQGDGSVTFEDLRGGRNGGDPALGIDPEQVLEALNVDYDQGLIAHKRGGATSLSLTFSSGGPFTTGMQALGRHVPSDDETAAEFWAVDGTGVVGRLAAATQWVAKALKANFTAANYHLVKFFSFNGKLYILGKTGNNRCQVWDGTAIRYVGLSAPTAAPTAATSAGAVTDTRKYSAAALVKSGSTILRRSELNQTPLSQALAAQRATVTLGGAPGEGETHWELYAASSLDNFNTQHYIGEAAIGVTIEDNNTGLTGVAPAPVGTYLVPPAAKYAVTDGDRIVFGSGYEAASAATYGQTPPKVSRLWWTPRLGDRDISDDERIISTVGTATVPAIRSYIDIDDGMTGLGGPVEGTFIVCAYRRSWRLSPTGQVTSAYRRLPLGVPYGCIFDKGMVLAEDETGASALYIPARQGYWRYDQNGPVFCGWDNQDIWATINLAATVPVHATFYPDKKQIWVWVATGSNLLPDTKLVFHTRYGRRHPTKGVVHGWTRGSGDSAGATCSSMFSNTVGATMSRDLKPYLGRSSGTTLLKADTSDLDDAGTPFQAYIDKVLAPPIPAMFCGGPTYIIAPAAAGVTLQHSITPDFGEQAAKTATVSLAATGSETKISRLIEDSQLSGIERSATLRIGDAAAIANTWTIDHLKTLIGIEQPL